MVVKRTGTIFFPVFVLILVSAWAWLILGLAPVLASVWDSIHDGFHVRGEGDGVLAEVMRNAGQAAHGARSGGQALLDYLFSAFNIALGLLLLKLRPFDTTARLLAVGMVGTAVAFNLQGHDAIQVVPVAWLGWIDQWHVGIHVISGLCYIFALLRFPADSLLGRDLSSKLGRLPMLAVLALFFTGLSLMTADDHTLGLVLVYGLFIPVTGVTAQVRRIRRARNDEQRQQSKVLLWALLLALLIAIPLMVLSGDAGERSNRTVDYEFTAPSPGTYFFRCDPHPVEMRGEVEVVAASTEEPSRTVELTANNNRFDRSTITLVSGVPSLVRLTNNDGDLHNVAIYESAAAETPLFIGAEFSGKETAVAAFRIFRIVFAVIPIALFIGIVRFRLWEIDRVINRGLVYGALAAFITSVYLAVVVGLGSLIGGDQRLSLVLSVAVTAVLAAAFHPLRDRARKLANRLVYGKRATPYEMLAELSERVGEAYALEEVIPEMAIALAEATGAKRAEIWLRVGDELSLSASWPGMDHQRLTKKLVGHELPEFADADRAVAVTHHGELLGALTVIQAPGRRLTPVEERLLNDVAAQAGLVLRNAQLTAELQNRLSDLRRSRQRIVAAQDAERRRLERDIHDGAQQHLVALSMKLRQVQELAGKDPSATKVLLEELQADTGDALQTLRDLARGIYPPVLADKGLVQALEAHARRCPVPVSIDVGRVSRHDADVEAAVYFCCLEAIQNAVKHSGRGPIEVVLEELNERLGFRVTDSGPGFDPELASSGTGLQHMEDRVAAVGGALEIRASVNGPVVVEGWIPVRISGPRSGV